VEILANALVSVKDISVTYRSFPGLTNSLKFELLNRSKRSVIDHAALKNISLDIFEGEVLGILGKNGAGKSTLAKVIAGMLRPQHGWVTTYGKVATMIELSAGINQDMTPYENVRLNSAINGLKLKDSRERAKRICEFAGLQKNIDSPIRTFSSGMAARFAFALSINIEPDILIADEILSVGDKDFQDISLKAMKELIRMNKCVLLVSHNMKVIEEFCNRAVWIDQGMIREDGAPSKVISAYENNL
jgi:ABC-type polysaccharide/polyol phosphate transport system ATPase subunit